MINEKEHIQSMSNALCFGIEDWNATPEGGDFWSELFEFYEGSCTQSPIPKLPKP